MTNRPTRTTPHRAPRWPSRIRRIGVLIAVLGMGWLGMLLGIFLLFSFGDPGPRKSAPLLGAVAMAVALCTPCVAVAAILGVVMIRLGRRYRKG